MSNRNQFWPAPHVTLAPHPIARSQALAKHDLPPGTIVLTPTALSFVLVPQEKGRRCDACCLRRETEEGTSSLKRCSGCASYWYCDSACQQIHWKALHKFMCKHYNQYQASSGYQELPSHSKLDAQLLSHFVAEHYSSGSLKTQVEDLNDPISTFTSLLPAQTAIDTYRPPICPIGRARLPAADVLAQLYQRFENNNFVIHSHLAPIAHGIFPLASRLFNHSCSPNAVASFVLGHQGLRMQVRSLREIKEGEEITMPYLDPALPYERRQQICQLSYGFTCNCPACTWSQTLGHCPEPPNDPGELASLEDSLVSFVFPSSVSKFPSKPLLDSFPRTLRPLLHNTYLPSVSSRFSDASHDGPFEVALQVGRTLLALYIVIYPPGYPQIGMHCLEMAKTAWNMIVADQITAGTPYERSLLDSVKTYLTLAKEVLVNMGPEGDVDGPWYEIEQLERSL